VCTGRLIRSQAAECTFRRWSSPAPGAVAVRGLTGVSGEDELQAVPQPEQYRLEGVGGDDAAADALADAGFAQLAGLTMTMPVVSTVMVQMTTVSMNGSSRASRPSLTEGPVLTGE
jgi:hypothetical protein